MQAAIHSSAAAAEPTLSTPSRPALANMHVPSSNSGCAKAGLTPPAHKQPAHRAGHAGGAGVTGGAHKVFYKKYFIAAIWQYKWPQLHSQQRHLY